MMRETDFDDPNGVDGFVSSPPDDPDGSDGLDGLNSDDGGGGEEGDEPYPDEGYVPRKFIRTSDDLVQPVGPAKTPPDPPKRGPGRPRKPVVAGSAPKAGGGEKKPGRPAGSALAKGEMGVTSRHFPRPVVFHFKDENPRDATKAPAFFQYMKRVSEDPELASRMILYVYRGWPVMRPDSLQQDKTTDVFEYKDIEHRYGAGDYHFKLNDVELRKTVAMCTAKGFRSEEYPTIVDYTKVDLTDPLNQSWIERAKSRGIKFPGAAETEEQEANMAEVRVMQQMGATVDKLTDRIITMSEKQKDDRPAAAPNVDHEAMSRGLGIVAEAASLGNTMLQNAINKVTEQTTQQMDPMEMLSKTMAMTKEIMQTANSRPDPVMMNGGDSQANNVIVEMMKQQLEMQRGFHDTLFQMQQGQINDLKAKLESNAQNTLMANVDHTPKTIVQQIEEMKTVKESMRDVLGISEEAADKTPSWVEHLPLIIQGLSVLGAVVANGLHNFAVIKTGQGVPAPPPGPDAVLSEEQKDAMRERGIPVAGPPQPYSPGQTTGGGPTMENTDMLTQYHQFLGMIQVPLLKSFQEGESGDEFAEKLMLLGDNGVFGPNLQGRQVYDMVTSNGKPTIMSLIKTYPPIWTIVKLTPDKWEKFMTDFFDAERLIKERWEAEEAEDREAAHTE
jgi:hypothetical protein